MSNIKHEDRKQFYNRYCIQSQTVANSRVYVNTIQRYNPSLNYSDDFGIAQTEIKQLYEISLFEEGYDKLIQDTTEYHELMNWIRRDPTAYKVYEQYRIMKVLGE